MQPAEGQILISYLKNRQNPRMNSAVSVDSDLFLTCSREKDQVGHVTEEKLQSIVLCLHM